VLLTVSDHPTWEDTEAHLSLLQRKIESYVDFIRSGQLAEQRPDSAETLVVIDVIMKHSPNEDGIVFHRNARKQTQELGIQLAHRILSRGDYWLTQK